MNFFAPLENKAPWLQDHTILLAHQGSRAYGTELQDSDTDVRGVFIPRLDDMIRPFESPEQYGFHGESVDFLTFDIRKFLRLATKGSPNIIETIWAGPETWIVSDELWKIIYENRQVFLTQDTYRAFLGYALGELRAIKSDLEGKPPSPGRQSIHEIYGFDTKKAYHALRISRMCLEIPMLGKVRTRRPDAEELVKVRNGMVKLPDILAEVEHNLISSKDIYQGVLPESTDKEIVSSICAEIFSIFYDRQIKNRGQ